MIGAGIMGLFSALFIAEGGRRVVAIDSGTPWAEASAVNAGSLGVQNKIPPLVPLALESLQLWADMRTRLGAEVGFRNSGGIRVAETEAEREKLRRGTDLQAAAGVRVEWLEGRPLRERAPFLSEKVLAGSYSPDDSFATPLLVGPALLRLLASQGVGVYAGVTLEGVAGEAPWTLETSAGTIRCEQVVITAGAWTQLVASLFAVHLPMSLDVNMVAVTEPAMLVLPWMVTHIRGILTLKQVTNGTFLIGGGWKGLGDLDDRRKEMDYESFLHNLRLAVRIVPALRRLTLLRHWSGYEGVTPDSLPYFGRIPRHDKLYVSAGVRGGFTLGPVFGRMMSELVLNGQTSFPVDAFAPGRFGNEPGTAHSIH